MLKIIRSNYFIITILIIIMAIFTWLIKIDYFNYTTKLTQLLPTETKLSVTLNLSELNATINQKNKLINNELISQFISEINQEITHLAGTYNISWLEQIKIFLDPEIIFYTIGPSNEWGVLARSKNKKILNSLQTSNNLIISKTFNNTNIYKLTTKNFDPIHFSFINNNIISISSNPNLVSKTIDNYINNADSVWQQRFSIINLEPILTIKIDPNINTESLNNPILDQIYNILKPIINISDSKLRIEFNQTGNFLNWHISNIQDNDFTAIYNQENISKNLKYIHFNPVMLMGSSNINKKVQENLLNNSLWQAIDDYFTIKNNIDFTGTIINKVKFELLLAMKDNSTFFLIIPSDNLNTTKDIIKKILAKHSPTSVEKILPDNTKYYELVADSNNVNERQSLSDNHIITTLYTPNNEHSINYYISDDRIILSNDYNSLQENIKNEAILKNYCLNNASFGDIFYINDNMSISNINLSILKELAIYNQSSDKNIVIRGCLRLK